MKLGISSYCLSRLIRAKEMTLPDVVEWAAKQGARHVEIVPDGNELIDHPERVEAIRSQAQQSGIEISNYAITANFITEDHAGRDREITRVMREVDIANQLGAKRMRHDVAVRPIGESSIVQFYKDLPGLADACAIIADYAAQYGITTSVENHGYYVQGSERVQSLVAATNRPNFRTTLDIGNFMCADENSATAVKRNIGLASMIHLKDFYLRPSYRNPGEGWFKTIAGNYLRGAIVGQGDIDMWEVLRIIKASKYDGYISIEFEGLEECRSGTKIAFENALRIWNEI
ncbi:sugar phosphate isomerase/epimerase family protein [Paenibacillus nasutitermitis]|uniref:Sugar phosphate isomerase n=1 Tax=Paenibacillus nasutitermitis TaxID=1652958 RepID=A0A916ZD58_9BACL|nr:sugar phosphate isomerase/epimerase family protein [Paenibacillus nasutitermitis]GGD88423.1 sugar phosphate isomerase [Paenibacillus nasutitermitis]